MKILLIDPPKGGWWLLYDTIMPNLGLAYLASYLREYCRYDVDIEIIDCDANGISWSDLEKIISREEPEIVGVSAITCNIHLAYKLCKLVKENSPKTLTVVGGPHSTFLPGEVLSECPQIDVVVRGEGEETFRELVEKYYESGRLKPVKGVSLRVNGRVKHYPDRELIKPLDKIPPPAWDMLPMSKYRLSAWGSKVIMYISSRGCPYRCTFCSEWVFWRGVWRPHTAERIVRDIIELREKYGKSIIWFGDDTFNISRERTIKFCKLILEYGVNVNWGIEARVDLLYRDRDIIGLMKEAGLFWTLIGIESQFDRDLKEFKKNISTSMIEDVVKVLREHDIIVQGMFIVGTPDDSEETILAKADYALKLDLDFAIFTPLTPLPGTILHDWAKRSGLLKVYDYSKYDFAHAVMDTKYLSYRQVQKLMVECYKRFYFKPFRTLRKMLSLNKFRRAVYWHFLKKFLF